MNLEPALQLVLERLYRLEPRPPVEDFRVHAEHVSGVIDPKVERESLLVENDGDETFIALFIAEDVRHRATQFVAGHTHELDSFCVAVEGVSHFVYFTFCGAEERPVSQAELELQAEIDKYLLLRLLTGLSGPELVAALFDGVRFAKHLCPETRDRYAFANRGGRRYARWLERKIGAGRTVEALEDARHLYRKPLAAKVDRIERAA